MMMERALEGMAIEDIFVFDVHAHMDNNAHLYLMHTDGESLVKTLDRLNIKGTCVSSNVCLQASPKEGNDRVLEAAARFPGRIYGYVTATAYYEDFAFEDYFVPGNGMVGIKIHAMMNETEISDKRYLPYLEYADKKGLPVLFHAWTAGEVAQVAQLAKTYKNCPLILGHGGLTNYAAKEQAVDAVKKYGNVYVDTCISSTYDGAIEWIVSKVGADRVLFGTDLGYFDCRQNYGKLALSKLSVEDKLKIFGENARKLFAL